MEKLECKNCGWKGDENELGLENVQYADDGNSIHYSLFCPTCSGKNLFIKIEAEDLRGWVYSEGK